MKGTLDDGVHTMESPSLSQERASRRAFLRRSLGMGSLVVGVEALGLGAVFLASPFLRDEISLGPKNLYAPSLPQETVLDTKGVFYLETRDIYLIHLSSSTTWQLNGPELADALHAHFILMDHDHTYWLAMRRKVGGYKLHFQPCFHNFVNPNIGTFFDIIGEQYNFGPVQDITRYTLRLQGESIALKRSLQSVQVAPAYQADQRTYLYNQINPVV
jgi:hypothetical protein